MKKSPQEIETDKKELVLKINPKEKDNLSKNQQMFNRLTAKIKEFEVEIKNEEDKLSRLLVFYSKKVGSLIIDCANTKVKLAMVLADSTKKIKFSKKQIRNISEVIISLCDEAFEKIIPDETQEAFYDHWSAISYRDEIKEQDKKEKDEINEFMKMFGMDIDLNDFEESPRGFSEFQEKLRNQLGQDENNPKKKRSQRQIELEEKQKEEEEIKNKSIRTIYISLVKVLHPDSETDPKLKAEKESIMKEVTSAYEKKDLPALLKLEMEWVYKETEHLEKITEDKLKIYITVLQERLIDLHNKKGAVKFSPQYNVIADYVHLSEKAATRKINSLIKEEKKFKDTFESLISDFQEDPDKTEVIEFIEEYLEEMLEDNAFTLGNMFDTYDF